MLRLMTPRLNIVVSLDYELNLDSWPRYPMSKVFKAKTGFNGNSKKVNFWKFSEYFLFCLRRMRAHRPYWTFFFVN